MARTVSGVICDAKKNQDEFIELLKEKYDFQITKPTLRKYNENIMEAPFRFVSILAEISGAKTDDFINWG